MLGKNNINLYMQLFFNMFMILFIERDFFRLKFFKLNCMDN